MVGYPDLPDNVKQFQQMIMQNAKYLDRQANEKADDDLQKSQVDTVLDEIMNLTIQHFLLDNLNVDDRGKTQIKAVAKKEFIATVDQIKERLVKNDHVEFLTNMLIVKLTKHFESLRNFLNNENTHYETLEHLKAS